MKNIVVPSFQPVLLWIKWFRPDPFLHLHLLTFYRWGPREEVRQCRSAPENGVRFLANRTPWYLETGQQKEPGQAQDWLSRGSEGYWRWSLYVTPPWKIVKSGEETQEKGESSKNTSRLQISRREQTHSGFLMEGTGVMLFIGFPSRKEWYLDVLFLLKSFQVLAWGLSSSTPASAPQHLPLWSDFCLLCLPLSLKCHSHPRHLNQVLMYLGLLENKFAFSLFSEF